MSMGPLRRRAARSTAAGHCRRMRPATSSSAATSARSGPTAASAAAAQGLTLVHSSAQPQPFWSHLPVSPCLIDRGEIMHPTYPTASVEPKSERV